MKPHTLDYYLLFSATVGSHSQHKILSEELKLTNIESSTIVCRNLEVGNFLLPKQLRHVVNEV